MDAILLYRYSRLTCDWLKLSVSPFKLKQKLEKHNVKKHYKIHFHTFSTLHCECLHIVFNKDTKMYHRVLLKQTGMANFHRNPW